MGTGNRGPHAADGSAGVDVHSLLIQLIVVRLARSQ